MRETMKGGYLVQLIQEITVNLQVELVALE